MNYYVKDVKSRLTQSLKKFKYFLITLIVIFIDQITKYWVNQNVQSFIQEIKIFENLNLVYVLNKGISFGFFSEMNISFYLGLISLTISFFIIYLILTTKHRIELLGLSFILGGALGNGIDRLLNHYVIDFIDLHLFKFHWPAFNFADFFITIGAFLYLFTNLKKKKHEKKT